MTTARRSFLAACGLITVFAGALPAAADPDDPAGWFLNTDPRRRAFLTYTATAGGPRLLMLACLRDAGTFTTMSSAVGPQETLPAAVLRLSDGASRFEATGEVSLYPRDGVATFVSDRDAEGAAMREIGRRLMPLLKGAGDLTIDIGPAGGETRRATVPRSGLAPLLPRFEEICFR
jgi:hypothetical protein